MKYKTGDKVRVRKDLNLKDEYGEYSAMLVMVELAGQIVTIKRVVDGDSYQVKGCDSIWWTDEMLEPIKEKKTLDNLEVGDRLLGSGFPITIIRKVQMYRIRYSHKRDTTLVSTKQLRVWKYKLQPKKKKLKHYLKQYGEKKVLETLSKLDSK